LNADSLSLYFTNLKQLADIETTLNKLEPLIKKSKTAKETFIELKYLARHLKTFNIVDKCRLDLSFVFNSSYHDGVIFQAILNNENAVPDILAAGGRYDKLIHEFLPPNSPFSCSTVGINIAVEKIISAVANFEQVNKEIIT
jgi:translation initiation factor 2-alpha kinase 4